MIFFFITNRNDFRKSNYCLILIKINDLYLVYGKSKEIIDRK